MWRSGSQRYARAGKFVDRLSRRYVDWAYTFNDAVEGSGPVNPY
jgi:hypothetical protein